MSELLDYSWLREHTALYLRDPERAHDWDATPVGGSGLVPTLLLTTVGRHSGERRPTPLLYQPTGTGFIVVASRGGSDHHPAWYLNLLANATCEVQVGRFGYTATARVLSSEERGPYWERMVRFWPDYGNYQARTSREIPVVILDAINR